MARKFKKFFGLLKKPKILISCIAALLALIGGIVAIVIVASDKPQQLDAPIVELNGNVAEWAFDENAEKWEISVDGVLGYIESEVTSKTLSDGERFKVRAIGDGDKYTDSEWSNVVEYKKSDGNGDQGSETVTYTVTWKNYDGTVLKIDSSVAEGSVPVYTGEAPLKPSDAQYKYTHSGWTPNLGPISSDMTYTATFVSEQNKYTVSWVCDGTVIELDSNVPYGSYPEYNGAAPAKAADAQYSYSFKEWSPQLSYVTSNVVYTAEFTKTLNNYTVTFYAENGTTILDTVNVVYGATASYNGDIPTKSQTISHTYTFDKWVTAPGDSESANLTGITGNLNVYASFKANVKLVSVNVLTGNSAFGSVSDQIIINVPYGTPIVANGNKLTIGESSVTATPKAADKQYTYTFAGWTAPSTVGHNTTVEANFVRTKNTYTITWKNGDKILETDILEYGATPKYDGEDPKHPTEPDGLYTFSGWDSPVNSVSGDKTYTAVFVLNENVRVVRFFDYDGETVLGICVVNVGGDAVYPNEAPTRPSTPSETYTFDKWVTALGGSTEATMTNITENKSFYATYTVSAREYEVVFRDYNGTILSTQIVNYGEIPTVPDDPAEREDFTFVGWDNPITNVVEDTIITAVYKHEVVFLDYNGTVIDRQLVDAGRAALSPYPDSFTPERLNYRFVGWDTELDVIHTNMTVNAVYVRQYKVTFKNDNGDVLKTEYVDENSAATAPTETPTRPGYTFSGWDKEFSSITADTVITAAYTVNTYTVRFLMPDGSVIDTQNIKYGFYATAPMYKELYFDAYNAAPYRFVEWDKSFDLITKDTEINAVYELITEPILCIESATVKRGTQKVTLTAYLCNYSGPLNGISFALGFNDSLKLSEGGVKVNDVFVGDGKKHTVEVKNAIPGAAENALNELKFASSRGNIMAQNSCFEILSIEVTLSKTLKAGEYSVDFYDDVYYVGSDLVKLTPAVLSGSVTVVE